MRSELQELLSKIEEEHKAMQAGLTGLASVARHEFMRKKWSNMDKTFLKIVDLVGTDKACELVVDSYEISLPDAPLSEEKPVERGYETAQIGDIIAYVLRNDQLPKHPTVCWYARILRYVPEVRYLLTPIQNIHPKRFWVRILDTGFCGCEELVLAEQVRHVYAPDDFARGVRDGTITLHE